MITHDKQMINATTQMNLSNKGWPWQLHNVPFNLFNILEKSKTIETEIRNQRLSGAEEKGKTFTIKWH